MSDYPLRDFLLYSACKRCGKPIKDPIKNYGKSDSPIINVLCCTNCIDEYINMEKGKCDG